MNTLELKSNIIELTEQTQNESVLTSVLEFFKAAISKKSGRSWSQLSDEEQNEVLEAFMEADDESSWISIEVSLEKLN